MEFDVSAPTSTGTSVVRKSGIVLILCEKLARTPVTSELKLYGRIVGLAD